MFDLPSTKARVFQGGMGPLGADSLVAAFTEICGYARTTDSVLSLDLPLGVRVLLTVLKKLYERRGSGRRENAL